MDKLHKAIKYCLWTAWVEDEKPVSLIIIGNPEVGKTSAIEKFKENNGIVYFNDVTPWGLTKELYKYRDLGKPINHIMIPDFLNILSKSQTSAKAMIQFLNSGIEEGLDRIQTFGITIDIPKLQFGIITAITTQAFKMRRNHWNNIGFGSRMIPFSYKYSIADAQEIIKSIFEQVYHNEKKSSLNFPDEKQKVELNPKLAEMMHPYTQRLASSEKLYGFRHQKQMQVLLKAIALSKKKNKVDKKDVKELQIIAEYFNLEFNMLE